VTGQTSLFPPEPAPDPLLCWLWLSQVLGPASLHAGKVLDAFGGAQEAWEARETEEFRQAAGDTAFKRAAQLDAESFHTLVMQCDALRVRILPFDDPDYPLAFSRIPDMPLVLYCTGDPRWLNEPGAVGIVGSRKPTEYGLNAAADIGGELAKNGAIIVSGLADGLDSAGHRAAVKNDCPTIAVMGVPIDRTYPAANAALRQQIERKGCVISEYPPYSEYVGPNCFLQRNRLIAALSSAVLVVEAREKSGTMSTVAHAERYGKPVYAVPGSIYSPNSAGTNGLLRDGRARAVAGAAVRLAAEQTADAESAKKAAEALGIECIVLNAEALAGQDADVLGEGGTPLFAALLTAADKLGMQYVATTHRARVETGADGVHTVCPPAGTGSDDSTILAALPQETLARLILPLGDFAPEDVAEMAEDFKV